MRTTPQSLEHRIMRRLIAILSASFILFALVYTFVIDSDAQFHATEQAGELAQDMARTIRTRPDGGHAFDRAAIAALADWPPGAAYAAIDLKSGTIVAGSSAPLLARLRNAASTTLASADLQKTETGVSVFATTRTQMDATPFAIAVQRPTTQGEIAWTGLHHEFTGELIPCFLPALLLAVLVTWLTLRANLQPLRQVASDVALVSVSNPGHRMRTEGLPAEITAMAQAVNAALGRLETGIAAQKRFAANAAHELRTPLAVLRARVDGLPYGLERTSFTRDIDRLTRAVSQMLLAARVQSHEIGAISSVALARVVCDVVADLAPLAQASGRDVQLETIDRPRLLASAPALESAVRNLIENALRFSPAGETVSVTVGPGPRVTVEDRGPGIPASDRAHIFTAFWRASRQAGDGAGLGLAIVREVAELHQGSIEVADRPGGGAIFMLTLGHALQAPQRPPPFPRPEPLREFRSDVQKEVLS
jgi:signal transduction histidine kinase